MVRALILTLEQMGDRAVLRVLFKSLLVTLILVTAIGLALVQAAAWYAARQGWGTDAGMMAQFAAGVTIMATAWLLFRAIALPVITFFADEIVDAVENRHFPDARVSARPVGTGRAMRIGLASLGRVLLFNLVALPGYVFLLFTGIGAIALFVIVNALLLGRDLAEMVAARHLAASDLKAFLRQSRGSRFILGLFATGLFMIPLINLLAPVIGAGMATHLFHRRPQ